MVPCDEVVVNTDAFQSVPDALCLISGWMHARIMHAKKTLDSSLLHCWLLVVPQMIPDKYASAGKNCAYVSKIVQFPRKIYRMRTEDFEFLSIIHSDRDGETVRKNCMISQIAAAMCTGT